MCFIRRTIAYLCLKIINFHAVDFSEHCSEDVISLFCRSVYLKMHGINGLVCRIGLSNINEGETLSDISGGSRICEKGGPGIQIPRCRARKSAKIGQKNKNWPKKGGGGPRPIRSLPGSATGYDFFHS